MIFYSGDLISSSYRLGTSKVNPTLKIIIFIGFNRDWETAFPLDWSARSRSKPIANPFGVVNPSVVENIKEEKLATPSYHCRLISEGNP